MAAVNANPAPELSANAELQQACFNYQLFKLASERYQSKPDQLDALKRQQAENAVQRQLALEDAVLSSREASRVSVPAAQVEEAVKRIFSRYPSEDDFLLDLDTIAMTPEQLRIALARELRVEAVLDMISGDAVPVTDTDASLYYYMNLAKFHRPEVRTARHILITINEDYPENQRAAAFDRVSALAKRLGKKSHRFAEQALKHSECPTAMEGGLLGKVKRGVLFPELEQVLFGLSEGQMSDPVESPLGFHLLLCETIEKAQQIPLDQVLEKIREHLFTQRKTQLQRSWIESLNEATNGRRVHG
jgi:peptidyl-prolyl cis-trans isomerase C